MLFVWNLFCITFVAHGSVDFSHGDVNEDAAMRNAGRMAGAAIEQLVGNVSISDLAKAFVRRHSDGNQFSLPSGDSEVRGKLMVAPSCFIC